MGRMARVRLSHVAWVLVCTAMLAVSVLIAFSSVAYADEAEGSGDTVGQLSAPDASTAPKATSTPTAQTAPRATNASSTPTAPTPTSATDAPAASGTLVFGAVDFDALPENADAAETGQAEDVDPEPLKGVLDAVNGAVESSAELSISMPLTGGEGLGGLALALVFIGCIGVAIRHKLA